VPSEIQLRKALSDTASERPPLDSDAVSAASLYSSKRKLGNRLYKVEADLEGRICSSASVTPENGP
jgi:hypothetical protein